MSATYLAATYDYVMLLHRSMLVHRRTLLIRRRHPYMSSVRLFWLISYSVILLLPDVPRTWLHWLFTVFFDAVHLFWKASSTSVRSSCSSKAGSKTQLSRVKRLSVRTPDTLGAEVVAIVTWDALTQSVDAVGMMHVVAAVATVHRHRTVRTYPLLCQFAHTHTHLHTYRYSCRSRTC